MKNEKVKTMARLWISFTALILSLSIAAQDTHRPIELDNVQVVAARRLKDVGVEKTSIDTLILHDNVSLSMADILSKNSTLFIKSYGRATESTAEFRGTSPSHTQVTWNGMKVNSPMLGTVDFSTIPSYFIDETNLYHGASSINITGGGLGGAVEMLTKPITEEGLHGQYVQGIGSFNTYDQFVRLTYHKKHWSSSTRVVYSTSDNKYTYTNYDKKTDVYDNQGNVIKSYHPKEKNKSGYFDDVHALQEVYYNTGNGNRIGLNVWYSHSKRGLPFLSVDYKDDADFKNEQKSNTLRNVLSWQSIHEDWTLNAKGGYIYNEMMYDYFTTRQDATNSITKSRSYTNTAFASVNADWNISERMLFTTGASAYYNHVKSSDMSPFHIGDNFNKGRCDTEVNAQIRWRPIDVLSLAAVLREEMHGEKIIAPIPAVFADVILYKPLNLVLKASVAKNYRYPSMDDLYFQPGGNKDLLPERGFTYDTGVEFGIKKRMWMLKGNVTAFDSYIKDWILWTPNTKGFWEPSNVKKVHNYGIEATANGELMLAKDLKITASANYAWTPSKNMGEEVNANDESYGKQLCYVPKVSANCNVKMMWKTWTAGCQWSHYSERFTTTSNEVSYITGKLKPYYMTDVSIEKVFHVKKIEFSVKGIVNNVLNTEYVTVLSHPMPGRNYEVIFKVKV